MPNFTVALVDLDRNAVPEWVCEAMIKEGFDFGAKECTTPEDLAQHAGHADAVWLATFSDIVSPDTLPLIPRCGAIVRKGSGTNNVPVPEATELGIVVANTPEAVSDALANHAIALLLAVVRRVAIQDRLLHNGKWDPDAARPRSYLHGQTLGLVGFGHSGRQVARKLSGFDMALVAYDPYVSADVMEAHNVCRVTLHDLLSRSDFISLHCPLTDETHHLIGEAELRSMRPSAVLINTSRGGVIDEPALVRALTGGWIAAAALDVFDPEPPQPDNPLLTLDNVVLTPHVAGNSEESEYLSWKFSAEAIIAMGHGRWPRSYVNPGVKPRWHLS